MMTALSTARPAYGLEGPSAGRTVDNAIPQGSTYRRGNFVQSNGAGSDGASITLVSNPIPEHSSVYQDGEINGITRLYLHGKFASACSH